MIIKSFELDKIKSSKKKLILIYGLNQGYKNQVIKNLFEKLFEGEILRYDENEILNNHEEFISNLMNRSLFDDNKLIIISRASDKIVKFINEIIERNIEKIKIIINSDNLEKKSKLRNLFEKEKSFLCAPFYPDTQETLIKITYNYFKEKKIIISQSNINLIVNKSNGDRGILKNELKKIEFYSKNKKVTAEVITKLTNLIENFSINELVDNCLAKNQKKTIYILNENNFNNKDSILIIKILINKLKKILILSQTLQNNNNINQTIAEARPPIFWKDKEITKKQISIWKPKNIKNLIFKLNEIELIAKKNVNTSINLVTDFILEQSAVKTNN